MLDLADKVIKAVIITTFHMFRKLKEIFETLSRDLVK